MATFHPKTRYGKSFRYGKPRYQTCVEHWQKALSVCRKIIKLPLTAVKKLNDILLNTLSRLSLNIAGVIVTAIRRPPFDLPGVSTRQFYMSQWREDATSINAGIPRLIYCAARIPDSIGIVITCKRYKPANCECCKESCK